MLNTIIIYISIHHGNTEKIAKAMAEPLKATLVKPHKVDISDLPTYHLLGFGSGIYHGKHHDSLLQLVSELPVMQGKKAFIFSTSGLRKIPFFHAFHKPLRKKLRAKKFELVGDFSCRGYDTYGFLQYLGGIQKGRPNQKDITKARKFAESLKERCKS